MMPGTSRYGLAVFVVLAMQSIALAAQEGGGDGNREVDGYALRTSSGEVTLEVEPAWQDGNLTFEIAANTHSVDLAEINLSEAVRLLVGGRSLVPDSAGRLRGHHSRAGVIFRISPEPERFVLEIRRVPDVPVRRLAWPLEGDTTATSTGPGRVIAVGGIGPGGLALLDGESLRVLRTVEGVEAVHGSAVDLDGTRAYALNMADSARAVTVIDVATGEMERTVELPGPGHHAAAGSQGEIVYVAYGQMALDPGTPRGIAAVDPATGRTRTVSTDGTPFYLAADPEGGRLYAAVQGPESGAGRLLILELPSLEIERTRELSGTPSHMVLSADGGSLFVALMEGRVLRLDVPALTVRAEGEAGPDAHAVAVEGSSGRVFVANRGAGTLTVLDAETLRRIDERDVAKLPTHLLALPDGRLLVSDGASKTLLALDPRTLEVLDRIELPFQPHQSSISGR